MYPTLIVDPNGPWHHDKESGETWLVQGVHDIDFYESLRDGEINVGDVIIEFQDNDGGDSGWSQFGVLRKWIAVEPAMSGIKAMVYLQKVDIDLNSMLP